MAVCWVIFRCQYIFTAIQVAHWYQGSVTSVWCHSWVLWQSKLPSCPVFMWTRGFECTRAVRSLVCVPCFVLERDARIQHYWLEFRFRWVRTLTLPFLSRCVSVRVSSSLGCALFSSRVFCVFVCSCFIGCVHSCYVLCCVAHSLWFSLAVCFHVVMSCMNMWLMSIIISCMFVSCFAHGLWIFCFAGHVFLFCLSTWLLSFFSVCHVLSCQLSWHRPSCFLIIGKFSPPVFSSLPS